MMNSIISSCWSNALEHSREYIATTYSLNSSTTEKYLKILSGFEKFANECNLPPDKVLKNYYYQITGKPAFEKPDGHFKAIKARVLRIIWDIYNGESPKLKYCYGTVTCPLAFQDIIERYGHFMATDQKSEGTIITRCGRIKVFFIFLDCNDCSSLTEITPELFCSFIASLDRRYSSQGKVSILYTVKNFFSYDFFSKELLFNPLSFLCGLHSKKHERLASIYTVEEIRSVLKAVNRDSPWGKTIYLMMLLACVYGLRSSDIKTLCMDDISWSKETITHCQWKTKKVVTLPLISEVKFALLDYLKIVRPLSDSQYIFIRFRKPHRPYSMQDHFGDKVSVFFRKAGIRTYGKHHGLHSLRHSLATSLLVDGVPVNEIAGILGHSSITSTKTYLWSDIEQLRSAALEVPSYDQ